MLYWLNPLEQKLRQSQRRLTSDNSTRTTDYSQEAGTPIAVCSSPSEHVSVSWYCPCQNVHCLFTLQETWHSPLICIPSARPPIGWAVSHASTVTRELALGPVDDVLVHALSTWDKGSFVSFCVPFSFITVWCSSTYVILHVAATILFFSFSLFCDNVWRVDGKSSTEIIWLLTK